MINIAAFGPTYEEILVHNDVLLQDWYKFTDALSSVKPRPLQSTSFFLFVPCAARHGGRRYAASVFQDLSAETVVTG